MLRVPVSNRTSVLRDEQATDATTHHEVSTFPADAFDKVWRFHREAILSRLTERWDPLCHTTVGVANESEAKASCRRLLEPDPVGKHPLAEIETLPGPEGSSLRGRLVLVEDQQRTRTVLCSTDHFETLNFSPSIYSTQRVERERRQGSHFQFPAEGSYRFAIAPEDLRGDIL